MLIYPVSLGIPRVRSQLAEREEGELVLARSRNPIVSLPPTSSSEIPPTKLARSRPSKLVNPTFKEGYQRQPLPEKHCHGCQKLYLNYD